MPYIVTRYIRLRPVPRCFYLPPWHGASCIHFLFEPTFDLNRKKMSMLAFIMIYSNYMSIYRILWCNDYTRGHVFLWIPGLKIDNLLWYYYWTRDILLSFCFSTRPQPPLTTIDYSHFSSHSEFVGGVFMERRNRDTPSIHAILHYYR